MDSRPLKRARSIAPELHRAGLTLVLTLLLTGQVWLEYAIRSAPPVPLAVLLTLALASCLPLLTVGRWPIASLVVMFAAAAAFRLVDGSQALTWAGPVVGVYTASINEGRRVGLVAAVLGAFALSVPVGDELTGVGIAVNTLRTLAVTGAAAAFGEANRSRRERAREAELRAEEAERVRASEAARAVDEERLRIARELHDVTAHSLSVISIQSELARRTLGTDPVAAETALEAIGSTSREALGELRAMLSGLRGVGDDTAPAPSLARIGDLVRQLEAAGIHPDARLPEPLPDLPPFVDASVYRIVQEAVTNVIRHSAAREATIAVDVRHGTLSLTVEDDGTGARAASRQPGHGLIGMRERAAALGGKLEAGPIAGGGWRVTATIPLPSDGTGVPT